MPIERTEEGNNFNDPSQFAFHLHSYIFHAKFLCLAFCFVRIAVKRSPRKLDYFINCTKTHVYSNVHYIHIVSNLLQKIYCRPKMSEIWNENLSGDGNVEHSTTDQSQSSITTTASLASSLASSLQSLSIASSIDDKNAKLKITLDNPENTYYSGQTIRGTISLNCKQKKKIRGESSRKNLFVFHLQASLLHIVLMQRQNFITSLQKKKIQIMSFYRKWKPFASAIYQRWRYLQYFICFFNPDIVVSCDFCVCVCICLFLDILSYVCFWYVSAASIFYRQFDTAFHVHSWCQRIFPLLTSSEECSISRSNACYTFVFLSLLFAYEIYYSQFRLM